MGFSAFRITCALWLLAGFTTSGGAQTPGDESIVRPGAAGRIVRAFDFEERETNPGSVPDLWFRAQDDPQGVRREGFPVWNQPRIVYRQDGAQSFGGEGAVELETRGGSASLLLGAGAVPVFPDADYRVSAWVRTDALTHAGAAVLARLLDAKGVEVPGSRLLTRPTRSHDAWSRVSLDIIGRHPEAAWLQLELLLLQPREAARALGESASIPHQIASEDFRGRAWFDDVSIMQLPRVEVRTAAPGNLVTRPSIPTLEIIVRDLAGEALTITTDVLDHAGNVIASTTRTTPAGLGRSDRGETWTPALPGLGWFRARVSVAAEGREIAASHTDFAWLPEGPSPDPLVESGRGFDLLLDDLPPPAWDAAPELAARLGAHGVSLPLWSADTTPEDQSERIEQLSLVVSDLIRNGREITLSLGTTPRQLAVSTGVEESDPLGALLLPRSEWQPFIGDALVRLGSRVTRLQIGRPGEEAMLRRPSLSSEVKGLHAALSSEVPGLRMFLAGSSRQDWSGVAAPVALRVHHDLAPEGVNMLAQSLSSGSTTRTLAFEPSPTPGLADHFARQVIELWAGQGESPRRLGTALEHPFRWVGEAHPQLVPSAEAVAFRTLAAQLSVRHVVSVFPAPAGVRCLLLAPRPEYPDAGPALIAWTQGAPPGTALEGFFGHGTLRVTDIFSNSAPAPPVLETSRSGGAVRIALSSSPLFIEGIDLPWCRFLASLRLAPDSIDLARKEHGVAIEAFGAWDHTLTGTLTVIEPGASAAPGGRGEGWRVSPRVTNFRAEPGRPLLLPLDVGVGPVQEVGVQEFLLELRMEGALSYGPVRIARSLAVGSPDLRLDLAARAEGADLIIEATLTNTGSSPANLRLTAFAAGHPRAKATITGLSPGQSAARTFRFDGIPPGQRVVVAAEDADRDLRLLESITIP